MRKELKLKPWLLGLCMWMGHAAWAQSTEFPTRQMLWASMQADQIVSVQDADDSPIDEDFAAFQHQRADEVRETEARLQNDDQLRAELADEPPEPPALPALAIQPSSLNGSLLEPCEQLQQGAIGVLHDERFSGLQRVLNCPSSPLLVLQEQAMRHGDAWVMLVREQVNLPLTIGGQSHGAILLRLKSSTSGNSQSVLIWREGNKVLTLLANDASQRTAQWLQKLAESLSVATESP